MPNRLPNWQSSLHAYINSVITTRFKYGSMDCGLFTVGAIQALTGVDVGKELRGRYKTRREAFLAIHALCGGSTMEAIGDFLAAQHGFSPCKSIHHLRRGDAVLIGSGSKSRLGILSLDGRTVLAAGRDGLVKLSLSDVTRGWHIG